MGEVGNFKRNKKKKEIRILFKIWSKHLPNCLVFPRPRLMPSDSRRPRDINNNYQNQYGGKVKKNTGK